MPRRKWMDMSLARKVSLLFGTAVLLTITVTLLFPLLQMNNLDQEAMLMKANWVATAAYQAVDLHQPNWSKAQAELARRWPILVEDLGLPPVCPTLVLVGGGWSPAGFRSDALDRLTHHPEQHHYWRIQDDGRRFRFAAAVRSSDSDSHPGVLRGIIDVRLAIPRQNTSWNLIVTVLAGSSGAVLAIVVFYMVTQRLVLSPVATLRRAAERVTTGDIEVQVTIASGDEFQDLSNAFNDMLAHLRSAQEELFKTNRSLDIRLGELAQTNVALYESVRLRSGFLANVSHELRTPLVSIIGFAELLRDAWENPDADRKRLARYTENILTSGRSLLDIINDLLDLAKIEAGKMILHRSRFSLAELCRDLIDFVRPLADKQNQQLDLQLASDLPTFDSDSGKIKQVLYNLLSNAIKFTPSGGTISLSAERVGDDHACLIVQDSGPGIPEDQRSMIFEKFHQADSSKTREFEGTGLGLAISKELVQMLGGTLVLRDTEPPGAVFAVTLPAHAPEHVTVPRIGLT